MQFENALAEAHQVQVWCVAGRVIVCSQECQRVESIHDGRYSKNIQLNHRILQHYIVLFLDISSTS